MSDLKRRIRETRAALRASACTCVDVHGNVDHDPYWVRCPRTMAEIAFHDALERAGFHA